MYTFVNLKILFRQSLYLIMRPTLEGIAVLLQARRYRVHPVSVLPESWVLTRSKDTILNSIEV